MGGERERERKRNTLTGLEATWWVKPFRCVFTSLRVHSRWYTWTLETSTWGNEGAETCITAIEPKTCVSTWLVEPSQCALVSLGYSGTATGTSYVKLETPTR